VFSPGRTWPNIQTRCPASSAACSSSVTKRSIPLTSGFDIYPYVALISRPFSYGNKITLIKLKFQGTHIRIHKLVETIDLLEPTEVMIKEIGGLDSTCRMGWINLLVDIPEVGVEPRRIC